MKQRNLRGLRMFAVAALLPYMAVVSAAQTPKASLSPADQAVVEEVTSVVRNFLAGVPKGERKTFDDFFADDVLYTRSAGVTVAKADIIRNIGVRATTEPGATYEADDITVHPYGSMAVINFRLVQHQGAQTNYFRNTGTFLKRNGRWQAVAWQSTKATSTR